MKWIIVFYLLFMSIFHNVTPLQPDENFKKGELIYSNNLSNPENLKGWIMEGPGKVEYSEGWMEMYSPDEAFHHVFWCPETFPGSFIAEWEAQNLNTEAGLCIIFFSALGKNGEDILDPSFPERDGTFRNYTRSEKLNCYHISYYANGKDKPDRQIAHLRKNSGFNLVYQKHPGIPTDSKKVHHLKLVKNDARILMYVDDRKIIDWTDDGKTYGPVLQEGKIGFRQMQWTHFRYRNFKVYTLQ